MADLVEDVRIVSRRTRASAVRGQQRHAEIDRRLAIIDETLVALIGHIGALQNLIAEVGTLETEVAEHIADKKGHK